MNIEPVTAAKLNDLADLFESNGSTRGCWCMAQIVPNREYHPGRYGENRRRFEALALEETIPMGLLGYEDNRPVAWCAVGPRSRYQRAIGPRNTMLKSRDPGEDDDVWLVPCFFVRVGCRRAGITGELLAAAVELAASHGASAIEGFPLADSNRSKADGYFGRETLFSAHGFTCIAQPTPKRALMRRDLPGRNDREEPPLNPTTPDVLVEPRPNGRWAVQMNGAQRAVRVFDELVDAINEAERWAQDIGADMVVKGQDGHILSRDNWRSYPRPRLRRRTSTPIVTPRAVRAAARCATVHAAPDVDDRRVVRPVEEILDARSRSGQRAGEELLESSEARIGCLWSPNGCRIIGHPGSPPQMCARERRVLGRTCGAEVTTDALTTAPSTRPTRMAATAAPPRNGYAFTVPESVKLPSVSATSQISSFTGSMVPYARDVRPLAM